MDNKRQYRRDLRRGMEVGESQRADRQDGCKKTTYQWKVHRVRRKKERT